MINGEAPLTNYPLPANALHIWHIAADTTLQCEAADFSVLDRAEQARAERIKGDQAKQQFIRIHAAVRRILSSYLDILPEQLRLSTTELNKPILEPGRYAKDIRFNLSHSGAEAVLAVALGRDIGVDLERVKIERKILPLSQRYFCEQTIRGITEQKATQQKPAFLRAWTQYEAYKKAQGEGLRGGDSKLTFSLEQFPANQFRPLFAGATKSRWQVASIAAKKGYIGTVVTEASSSPLVITDSQYRQET